MLSKSETCNTKYVQRGAALCPASPTMCLAMSFAFRGGWPTWCSIFRSRFDSAGRIEFNPLPLNCCNFDHCLCDFCKTVFYVEPEVLLLIRCSPDMLFKKITPEERWSHVSCMLFGLGGVILTVKFWKLLRLRSLRQSVENCAWARTQLGGLDIAVPGKWQLRNPTSIWRAVACLLVLVVVVHHE